MSTNWILGFEKIGKAHTLQVGTKSANLGELTKIGVPVPQGFVVTAGGFARFLEETGARGEISKMLNGFLKAPRSINEYQDVSSKLRQIICTAEMPREIEADILRGYELLCKKFDIAEVPVAVRSSGCVEDLPTAAFAGQYDSYLNVRGQNELLEKVRECWASLFTARVISYRIKNNLPVMDELMGVIVQKLVNARSAGVAFTALPSTGDQGWIVIEGNWGMAESVVQGVVSPDKYYINKEKLAIEEIKISKKLKQYSLFERGVIEEELPIEKQSMPCLSEEETLRIAGIARRIESHYGTPQDIEWAVEKGLPFPDNVFFVQTRPITTLKKKTGTDQVIDLMLSHYLKR